MATIDKITLPNGTTYDVGGGGYVYIEVKYRTDFGINGNWLEPITAAPVKDQNGNSADLWTAWTKGTPIFLKSIFCNVDDEDPTIIYSESQPVWLPLWKYDENFLVQDAMYPDAGSTYGSGLTFLFYRSNKSYSTGTVGDTNGDIFAARVDATNHTFTFVRYQELYKKSTSTPDATAEFTMKYSDRVNNISNLAVGSSSYCSLPSYKFENGMAFKETIDANYNSYVNKFYAKLYYTTTTQRTYLLTEMYDSDYGGSHYNEYFKKLAFTTENKRFELEYQSNTKDYKITRIS